MDIHGERRGPITYFNSPLEGNRRKFWYQNSSVAWAIARVLRLGFGQSPLLKARGYPSRLSLPGATMWALRRAANPMRWGSFLPVASPQSTHSHGKLDPKRKGFVVWLSFAASFSSSLILCLGLEFGLCFIFLCGFVSKLFSRFTRWISSVVLVISFYMCL